MTVVMNYGMGADSTAILLRWLEDPSSRDFDLKDMIVLTAQTGDEFEDTRRLVEVHMLPRFREFGIRYVQVARADKTESVEVLDDSRSPRKVYIKGKYRLSDELLSAGTVPTVSGVRKCSIHAKGWPLDAWLEKEFGDRPFTQVIGFNAGEQKRVDKDQSFGGSKFPHRRASYPLMEWGWDRETLELYIESVVGEKWEKSCCNYCPFAAGKESILVRYRSDPQAAGFALFIEFVSLCLNPRMTLYSRRSLYSVIEKDGNKAAIRAFLGILDSSTWSVYHVRRIYRAVALADRSIKPLGSGTRGAMERVLAKYGQPERDEHDIPRVVLQEKNWPASVLEEMYVVAPGVVEEKAPSGFDSKWGDLSGKRQTIANPAFVTEPIGPVFNIDTEEDDSRAEQARWVKQLGVFPDLLPGVKP